MNLRRKRLRLMRDTQWRGYARTAEGNPITLSQIRSVLSLSVLGNSSQSGTPSPDNPVEVVGSGVRTGNLFDVSKIKDTALISIHGNDITITNYTASTNFTPELLLEMTGLSQGDTITTSRKVKIIDGTGNNITGRISFMRKDKASTFVIIDGTDSFRTTVIPDDFDSDNYNTAVFYGVNAGDTRTVIFSEVQILKGEYTSETLPPYEPYGYKVAVTASGRNLFKQTGNTYSTSGLNTVAEHQEYIINGTSRTIFNLSLEKNINLNIAAGEPITFVTEILDGEIIYPENSEILFSLFNSDNSQHIRNISIRKPQKGLIIATGNLPSTNSGYNIYIQCLKETGIVFNNVRIRLTVLKGAYTAETLPPYEPYKPPQSFNVYSPDVLHGVGAAHDTVILDFDKHKAELKKNILQYEHSDNWILGSSGKNNVTQRFYQPTNNYFVANSRAISNVFVELNPSSITIINNDTEGFNCSNNNYLQVRVNKSRLDTVDDSGFKSWLAAYEETTPLIIYGETLTPVTTDITALQEWKSIPNLKGTWILTAEGGTEPLLKAAYTSNTNPYPDYSNIVSVLPIYPDLDITGDDPTSERGDMEETEDQQETTSTDEPTSETNNSIDILDLYE